MREEGGDGRARAVRTRRGGRAPLWRRPLELSGNGGGPGCGAPSRDGAREPRAFESPRDATAGLQPPARPTAAPVGGRSLPGEGFSGGDGAVSFSNRRSARARA